MTYYDDVLLQLSASSPAAKQLIADAVAKDGVKALSSEVFDENSGSNPNSARFWSITWRRNTRRAACRRA